MFQVRLVFVDAFLLYIWRYLLYFIYYLSFYEFYMNNKIEICVNWEVFRKCDDSKKY